MRVCEGMVTDVFMLKGEGLVVGLFAFLQFRIFEHLLSLCFCFVVVLSDCVCVCALFFVCVLNCL